MGETDTSRAIRFAAFLISGSVFLTFAIEVMGSAVSDYLEVCVVSPVAGQCSGSAVWTFLSPLVSGGILVALGLILYVLAYGARNAVATTPTPAPTPPP